MTTGNKIVDEISVLHINSIPEAWYRTIVRNNQPHAMAILVLWDLVYWYKWTEVRDEASGMVVSYKKKFKADLLQRSYDAIASKFGITKRQATDIIVFLEKLGALKRVFRNIKVANTTLSNVLFIELVPNVIKDLSHVELGEVSRFDGRGSHVDSGEGLTDLGETYTTSSTTNTTTNINSSPNKSESEPFPEYTPNKTKRTRKSDNNKTSSSFPQKDYDDVMSIYYENRNKLSETQSVDKTKYLRQSYQSIIKPYFVDYGVDTVKQAVRNSIHHSWVKNTGYTLSVIFNRKKFDEYVADSKGSSFKSDYQKKRAYDLERGNMNTGNRDYTL